MRARDLYFVLAMFCVAAPAASQEVARPDFSGLWDRGGTVGSEYRQPESGPGPLINTAARGEGAGWRGNYDSPILQPWAAAVVKEKVDKDIAGINIPEPKELCVPMGVPHILQLNGVIQVLPGSEVFTILYMRMMQARFIEVDGEHRADLEPSYYGHSVGRWEGDVFVVDTVGFNDKTPIDMFATPHTEQLHVVERYRLVDGGETLRVDFTIDDPAAFTTPWSAYVTYGRPIDDYLEFVCMENNRFPDGSPVPSPIDETPDF